MLFQVLQEAEVAEQQDDANGGDKSFGESFGGGGASSRKSRKFSSGLLDYGEGREKKRKEKSKKDKSNWEQLCRTNIVYFKVVRKRK